MRQTRPLLTDEEREGRYEGPSPRLPFSSKPPQPFATFFTTLIGTGAEIPTFLTGDMTGHTRVAS